MPCVQVLSNETFKQEVLSRTPLKRIATPDEVAGGSGVSASGTRCLRCCSLSNLCRCALHGQVWVDVDYIGSTSGVASWS